MFKDKFGRSFGLNDFIIYTRYNSDRMVLAEIVGIKNDWGYLCDTVYYDWNGHNKLDLVKGEHRIIKLDDPKLIKTLKTNTNYIDSKSNINELYQKLNK